MLITVVVDAVFEHGVTASLGNLGQIETAESFCSRVLPQMLFHAIAVSQLQQRAERPHQRVHVEALQSLRIHRVRVCTDQSLGQTSK